MNHHTFNMKHVFFIPIALILLTAFSACKNIEVPVDTQQTGEVNICFNVSNYKQYPLDDVTQSDNDEEARNMSTRSAAATSLAHLQLSVFDVNNKLVHEIKQEKDSNGYGKFSLSLPYGTYTLVFFGYNGSRLVEISSPTDVHFTDGYTPNCFYKSIPLTINKETQTNQDVVLERPVACFSLRCPINIVPKNLAKIEYTIEDCGTNLNSLTGLSTQTDIRHGNLDVSLSNLKVLEVNIYTFLPATESKAQMTIVASDNEGKEITTRHFIDVPMKINQRTVYDGDFFGEEDDPVDQSANMGFSLLLENNEWNEVTWH